MHLVCGIAETQKLSAATGIISVVSQCTGYKPNKVRSGRSTCEFVGTSSTCSTMSVGLVETLLPRPLTTAAPHTTIFPGTAARPVSTTTFTFLTDSTLRQRRWRTTIHLSRNDCITCGVQPHIRMVRVFSILHMSSRLQQATSHRR